MSTQSDAELLSKIIDILYPYVKLKDIIINTRKRSSSEYANIYLLMIVLLNYSSCLLGMSKLTFIYSTIVLVNHSVRARLYYLYFGEDDFDSTEEAEEDEEDEMDYETAQQDEMDYETAHQDEMNYQTVQQDEMNYETAQQDGINPETAQLCITEKMLVVLYLVVWCLLYTMYIPIYIVQPLLTFEFKTEPAIIISVIVMNISCLTMLRYEFIDMHPFVFYNLITGDPSLITQPSHENDNYDELPPETEPVSHADTQNKRQLYQTLKCYLIMKKRIKRLREAKRAREEQEEKEKVE